MSYLERLQAKASMRADGELPKGSEAPFGPFGSDRTGHVSELPADLAGGIQRLRAMPAPRIVKADLWTRVVRDALALADAGWASKALALGWPAISIFGAVTDPAGDRDSDGLAVWLGGRKLLAITATTATVEDGEGRAYFIRREQVGARLIWELDQ